MIRRILDRIFKEKEYTTSILYHGPKCNYCNIPIIEIGLYYRIDTIYICTPCSDRDKLKVVRQYLKLKGKLNDYPEFV